MKWIRTVLALLFLSTLAVAQTATPATAEKLRIPHALVPNPLLHSLSSQ
ncbi:MAG: hypothetical protein HC933_20660 [Pleurocapsa sp. SU_196_0]|nr:hypothetical protein [Pleurocapsa sp. SU_196_0]